MGLYFIWAITSRANRLFFSSKIWIEYILLFDYVSWFLNWETSTIKGIYFRSISCWSWALCYKLEVFWQVFLKDWSIHWTMTPHLNVLVGSWSGVLHISRGLFYKLALLLVFSKLCGLLLWCRSFVGTRTRDWFHFINRDGPIDFTYKWAISFFW